MSRLRPQDRLSIVAEALRRRVAKGQLLFRQGVRHSGIYIIRSGSIRTFYIAPTGRQITLGYWGRDDLVGGPEVFGRGIHLWSGEAVVGTDVLYLRGSQLDRLCHEIPEISFALIDILVDKGRRFSEVVQMLGTKSTSQRLAHILVSLSVNGSWATSGEVSLARAYTHEELASMVGATRQWVSISLKRFEERGLLRFERRRIVITSRQGIREEIGL